MRYNYKISEDLTQRTAPKAKALRAKQTLQQPWLRSQAFFQIFQKKL